MHKTFSMRASLRFRRYCRAAYAAFSSMHREVTIGRVATYIADRSQRKQCAPAAAVLLLLSAPTALSAQSDPAPEERTLPAVEIILAADSQHAVNHPAASLPASALRLTSSRSVGDALRLLPGLDLRTRGVDDVQADLSMRGGTFDQMVVLMDGLNLTDAQTGHHALDLPIDLAMVSRIDLLTPAQLLARGIVGFCGGVDIAVSPDEPSRSLAASFSLSSFATAHAALRASQQVGKWHLTAATAYNRSDGYRTNTDYRFGSLLLQARRRSVADEWLLQLGGQAKGFGSYAFYSTSYPDQYEATRTLTASASETHHFSPRLSMRLHTDRFELFREGRVEAPAWYGGHNHHLGDLAALRTRLVCGDRASLGFELRQEGIASNVLGDSLATAFLGRYPKATSRSAASLFGNYAFSLRRTHFQLSALGTYSSRFGTDYAAAATATRQLKVFTFTLSASRTYRLPTFTDLYYQSVNQQANPDLQPEHSWNFELSSQCNLQHAMLKIMAYRRLGRDIIDWVRTPQEELWHATNHTRVNATGLDFTAQTSFRFSLAARKQQLTAGFSYSLCHLSQQAEGYISGSALDYLRHRLVAHLALSPTPRLTLKADLAYRIREGYYVEDGVAVPYANALLCGMEASYRLHRCLSLSLAVSNLLDTPYRDHGGIPMPGRTFTIGLSSEL